MCLLTVLQQVPHYDYWVGIAKIKCLFIESVYRYPPVFMAVMFLLLQQIPETVDMKEPYKFLHHIYDSPLFFTNALQKAVIVSPHPQFPLEHFGKRSR